MKNYSLNGNVYVITLDNGKVVKIAKDWVDKTITVLNTDLEDVILMWLEDNDYLVNEEQEELDTIAKENKPKINAKAKTERKKVVRERKPNPTKEMIISEVAKMLNNFATDIQIENVGKIITFKVDNKDFKLDLTEKRVKKQEK
jgi:hypothetical protein